MGLFGMSREREGGISSRFPHSPAAANAYDFIWVMNAYGVGKILAGTLIF